MTKQRLQTLKTITTWGGVLITLSGIALSGHWISAALDRHKAAERAADEERFSEMESMSELLNDAGVFDRPESLKRMIREHQSRYDIEHQDDGR